MGTASSPIIILSDSDDDDVPVAPVAAVPRAVPPPPPPAQEPDDNGEFPRPDWLPQGFGMRVYRRLSDGSALMEYTCPVMGVKKKLYSEREVREYVSSGAYGRAVAAAATLDDKTTLQGKYKWLVYQPRWGLEIRAGGPNMNKLFKFYAYWHGNLRFTSQNDAVLYMHEETISKCSNLECDTTSEDNIIAQLHFCIPELPPGWVKEIEFRKVNGGMRRDVFYTDPINQRVYRSLTTAKQYFESGIEGSSYKPIKSVTDLYLFDNYIDMLPCLAKRLKMEENKDKKCGEACETSQSEKVGTKKRKGKTAVTSSAGKPPKPRGRPRKAE
ncbi:hypothetical protein ACP70R_010695 [Stipagrostis hirtigluma subsp. patula]